MLKIPLSAFLLSLGALCLQAQDQWKRTLSEAKTENQNILIIFSGSDWCVGCIRFEKEVLLSDSFKEFAQNKFQWYRADFPRKKKNQLEVSQQIKNDQLLKELNPGGQFPRILLVNTNLEIIWEYDGPINLEKFIDALNAFFAYG